MPVTLPPGRARLWAQPSRTGSLPDRVTIGIVAVALRAASRDGWPAARMTSTLRRTRSAAIAASRSGWPSAKRRSMTMFWPSTKPASRRPWRKPASFGIGMRRGRRGEERQQADARRAAGAWASARLGHQRERNATATLTASSQRSRAQPRSRRSRRGVDAQRDERAVIGPFARAPGSASRCRGTASG